MGSGPKTATLKRQCPQCGQNFEFISGDKPSSFPFCSDRCKLLDLGAWASGKYAVPSAAAPVDSSSDEDDA